MRLTTTSTMLSAPPVEELDRRYSLEEVRRSHSLRERMRRVDIDTINFEFGSGRSSATSIRSWSARNRHPPRDRPQSGRGVPDRRPHRRGRLRRRQPDAVGQARGGSGPHSHHHFEVAPENLTTQGYGEEFLKIPTQGPNAPTGACPCGALRRSCRSPRRSKSSGSRQSTGAGGDRRRSGLRSRSLPASY